MMEEKKKLTYQTRINNQIKIRKKLRDVNSLSDADKWQLIDKYSKGSPILDLAEEYKVLFDHLEKWFKRVYGSLVNIRETNSLMAAQAYSAQGGYEVAPSFKNPELVNKEFNALLSDENSSAPSPAELAYAETYALTGDNQQAIAISGLDTGIMRTSKNSRTVLQLRGIYLRNKPAVREAIQSIKDKLIQDLLVDKSVIQTELIHQIAQLKEEVADRPVSRGQLMKAIELLGKTIPGTFAERIEVEEVNRKVSLIDMVKQAEIIEMGGDVTELLEEANG